MIEMKATPESDLQLMVTLAMVMQETKKIARIRMGHSLQEAVEHREEAEVAKGVEEEVVAVVVVHHHNQ